MEGNALAANRPGPVWWLVVAVLLVAAILAPYYLITDISDQVIARNGSTGPLRFDVNDAETLPAMLRVSASSSDSNLIPPGNIVVSGVGGQRTIRIAAGSNQVGVATITVSVMD